MSNRHIATAAISIVVLVAACAPAAGTGAPATAGPTSPGGSIATSGPVPTAGPVGTSAAHAAVVDLTFTGTYDFVAKGRAGTCKVFTDASGSRFGFEATEADYPGLGISYSMAEFSGIVDIKWARDDVTSWANNPESPIRMGSDHRTVTLDQDLLPFTAGNVTAGPEHVKGSIACP